MTNPIKAALGIVLAVILLIGGWIGYERYQDYRREQRSADQARLEDAQRAVVTAKDDVREKTPGVVRADSTLTGILRRPRPRIVYVTDTVAGVIDSAAFVPKVAYDSLHSAATAYRDSTRALLVRYPKLVASMDSVIHYQARIIANPKPRRNLGCGPSLGYGATLSGQRIVTGPSVLIGCSYTF